MTSRMRTVASVENVIDDLAFLLAEGGCSTDDGADLLVSDLLPADIRIASEQPDSNIGRHPQKPDHRTRQLGDEVHHGASLIAKAPARCSARHLAVNSP